MGIYKIIFKPLEEYFFGDEGSFGKMDEIDYFMRTRKFPTQTTIFGIVRFLNLAVLKEDYRYTPEEEASNEKAVGKSSFNFGEAIENMKGKQDFGQLKAMSSVFLYKCTGQEGIKRQIYLPLPKDAMVGSKGSYQSFFESQLTPPYQKVMTIDGERWLPNNYDSKTSFLLGDICLDGSTIEDSILEKVEKTSLLIYDEEQRGHKKGTSSLFKKEYGKLKEGYGFGVYVVIDEADNKELGEKINRTMGVGLGKKQFSVQVTKATDAEEEYLEITENEIKLKADAIFESHPLKNNIIYCMSPTYIETNKLKECVFASISTTANRPLQTRDKCFCKDADLYRMMEAGSVLFVEQTKKDDILKALNYKDLKKIGYNHYYHFKGGR